MRLIILGAPGCGKGTISERLVKDMGFKQISAGVLLREEIAKGTTIGKDIKQYIESGGLVPDRFVTAIVKLEIGDKDHYILDGFPRSVEQAKDLDGIQIDLAIYLEVTDEIVKTRFAGRRICPVCKTGYHIKNIPPRVEGKCDNDGADLVTREDDKPEIIANRLQIYHKTTAPVIDYFKAKGILETVDGNGSPDEVVERVEKLLKEKI